jgi:hypothetical protein
MYSLAWRVLLGCSLTGIMTIESTMAQTCSNGEFAGVITANGSFSGNTCGHNSTINAVCQDAVIVNKAGLDIWPVHIGPENASLTFTVQTDAFTPAVALIGAPCSSSLGCVFDNSAVGPGTVSGNVTTGTVPGDYFLFVADYATESPGCGSYTLSVTGTLGSGLDDEIFQSDFENM